MTAIKPKGRLEGAALAAAIEENIPALTKDYEPEFSSQLVKNVAAIIDKSYFRSELIGFDELPERNNPDVPLIYAGNHSGMAFPWDAMIFGARMHQLVDFDVNKGIRPLSAPALSQSNLMNPYMIKNLWKRSSSLDATSLNFETLMLHSPADVLIYPEGVPGIGKGFNNKYKLQKFSTSMIRMSLKYKTDIIPVYTINGEYLNPYSYSIKPIDRLVQMIGIPYLPITFILPLLLLFPWMFYFAFPAKLTYVRGTRLSPYKWLDKPFEEVTRADLEMCRDRVMQEMQRELEEGVKQYGQKPYRWGELWSKIKANFKYYPYHLPWGWPAIFLEFQRRWVAQGKKGKLEIDFAKFSIFKAIANNPILVAYYIPILGWIPILYFGLKGREKGYFWKG
ncbi:MAG: hypothetical protein ACPGJS_22755 [Flammeovirgaceae bacterium]